MRKVFLSTSIINRLLEVEYISEDFNLQGKQFKFPITYLINNNVKNGDCVAIITAVMQTEMPMNHYKMLKDEIWGVLKERQVDIEFIEIKQYPTCNALDFSNFFKEVADLIKEEDKLYLDITFSMKTYLLGMFIAVTYAVKAGRNVDLDTIIYAEKYTGNEKDNNSNQSKLYDATSLFYLNNIAGNAAPGERKGLDKALALIISNDD